MELIIFIIIIAYIVKAAKKSNENEARQNNANRNPWDGVAYQAPKQATRVNSARVQVQQQTDKFQKAAQENIAKAKQRVQERQENISAMQQVHAGRMEARNTTILQRAKTNTDADKVDVTLETMEAEHNHSERVAPAVHHHPEDSIPESMLGSIEDLMVKGFDGNLCFERDFVGEAMDMISHFTVPSEVPDFSKDDVA